MRHPLIEDTTDPGSEQPALRFAGRRFLKLGPTRPEEVVWFERHQPGERDWAALAAENQRQLLSLRAELAMDEQTVRLLRRLLTALADREPLLIEGPPASSKTAGVRLAAALCGLPLIRLNLSAATDVTDLIGKFVPSEEGGWRWQDGPVVDGLRRGALLYLDELNLGRPGILDRLLPLLEPHPRLLLSENRGEVVRAHPDTRFLATINSVDHQGRRPLSGPMRSRFTTWFSVPPDRAAFTACLRHWTMGRSAEWLEIGGARFSLAPRKVEERVFPTLARVTGMRPLIPLLARFQSALHERCQDHSIGRERREPYHFDRRSAWRFCAAMERRCARLAQLHPEGVDLGPTLLDVLQDHYLYAVEPGADRLAVRDQAQAVGLMGAEPPTLALPARAPVSPLPVGSKVRYQGELFTVASCTANRLYIRNRARGSIGLARGDLRIQQDPAGVPVLSE